MTIAYIRTYSNKQQTESQKNAIEQFAKAKKIEIDKWLKDAKNSSKEKNRLEDVIKKFTRRRYSYRRRCHSTQQETNGDNAFDFVVY